MYDTGSAQAASAGSVGEACCCADTSVVVESSGSRMFVDEFESYEACLQALQRMEFDASLGEVEVLADGSMCMAGSFCSSVLLNVSIVNISDEDVAHCVFKEVQDVSCEKFYCNAPVWLSRTHPCRDSLRRCAHIKNFGWRCMDLVLPAGCDQDELRCGFWRVDADFVMYGLQWTLECLSAFVRRRSEPLQRLIVEDLNTREAEKLQRPRRGCRLSEIALKQLAKEHRLNESQRRALVVSTETILLLIHGPPGTGKTQTIVALLHLYGQSGSPACCLAGANLAVDNACKRARQEGLEVVRTGNIKGDRVDASMLPCCLEKMAEVEVGDGKNENAKKKRREWSDVY